MRGLYTTSCLVPVYDINIDVSCLKFIWCHLFNFHSGNLSVQRAQIHQENKWVNNQWAICQFTALLFETRGGDLYIKFMQQLKVWTVKHFLFWVSSLVMLDHACWLHNNSWYLKNLYFLEHDTCRTACSFFRLRHENDTIRLMLELVDI